MTPSGAESERTAQPKYSAQPKPNFQPSQNISKAPGRAVTESPAGISASWNGLSESGSEQAPCSRHGDSFTITPGNSFATVDGSRRAENASFTMDEPQQWTATTDGGIRQISAQSRTSSKGSATGMSITSFFGHAKNQADDIEKDAISTLQSTIALQQVKIKSQGEDILTKDATIQANEASIASKDIEISRQRTTISILKDDISAKTWAMQEYEFQINKLKLQGELVPFLHREYLSSNRKLDPSGMKYSSVFEILHNLVLTNRLGGLVFDVERVRKRIGELHRSIFMLDLDIEIIEAFLEEIETSNEKIHLLGKQTKSTQTEEQRSERASVRRGRLNVSDKIQRLMLQPSSSSIVRSMQETQYRNHEQHGLKYHDFLLREELCKLAQKKEASELEKHLLIFISGWNTRIRGQNIEDGLDGAPSDYKFKSKKVTPFDAMQKNEDGSLTIDDLKAAVIDRQCASGESTNLAICQKRSDLKWLQNRSVDIISKKKRLPGQMSS